MHAALNDYIRLDLGRLHCQLQRVSYNIGNAMINFRRLVVMRQYGGATQLLELIDRVNVGRVDGPFYFGNVMAHLLVKRRSFPGDLFGIFQRWPVNAFKLVSRGHRKIVLDVGELGCGHVSTPDRLSTKLGARLTYTQYEYN